MTFRSIASLAAAAALLAGLAPQAFAQAATLVPAQSEITFTSKQMGVPVDGRFKRFDAQITLDPKKPEAGSVAFKVDLTSVSMGAAEVETELAKPGWFDSQKTANATFQSTSIKSSGAGRIDVTGKLTIKGSARDLVVPVALSQAGANTTAQGSFVLKRLDYKIGDGDWSDTSMVANEVQVKFKLVVTGVGPL